MKLELFTTDFCPFCRRGAAGIDRSGRADIEYLDVLKSAENRKRLVEAGGKEQVPCLLIDGKPLYESMDIIDWLRKHPAAE